VRTDGLQRCFWWVPQHSMAYALGLVALATVNAAGSAASTPAVVIAGVALGGATMMNPFVGAVFCVVWGLAVAIDAAKSGKGVEAMAAQARADGIPLTVRSAYRSEARQAQVFREWAREVGRRKALRVSARPGHSEHQLGTTIDFARGSAPPWAGNFAATSTGRWLARNAADFGFVMSYPKDASDVTCYAFEPWHFRWIGRERAAAVTASGLRLREWLWRERPVASAD